MEASPASGFGQGRGASAGGRRRRAGGAGACLFTYMCPGPSEGEDDGLAPDLREVRMLAARAG